MIKMKFSLAMTTLSLLLSVLVGCGPASSETSVPNSQDSTAITSEPTTSTSDQTTSQSDSASQTSTSAPIEELSPSEYEESLSFAPWTQADHLYIHYYRSDISSLDDWTLWVWQKVPKDLQGFRVDYTRLDQSGAIFEVDLSDSRLSGVTKLGFLIVLKTSMEQTAAHWVSDSGGNVYIDAIPDIKRLDGTIHVFATEGKSGLYSQIYEGNNVSNPYEGDTGQLVSKSDVDSSSTTAYTTSPTSVDFKNNAVVGYQIQVATFADSNGDGIGDLRGIINKLDYLDNLNVNALWLTPVQDSESYHGYDTIDYYKIDARFGTLEDYRELVYKAHQKDIRVIMDLVVNHTSKNNHWFLKSAQVAQGLDLYGNNIDYRDLYHWRYSTSTLQEPWYRFADTNYYYYGKFASSMPELNYDNQTTRDFMIDVAKYWLGFGVDGFRIDAVKHVYMADEVTPKSGDTITQDGEYSANLTKNLNFFKEFSSRLKSVYPDTYIVGENFDGWDQRIAPYLAGMDSLLDFPGYYHFVNNNYHRYENNAYNEANSVVLGKISMFDNARKDKAILASFTSNHDVERMINHVNNSYTGSGSSVTETHAPITLQNQLASINKVKAYASVVMLQPGLSFIYYGDELGMSGNITPNNENNAPSDAIGQDWNEDRWYRQPMKWVESSEEEQGDVVDFSFSGYTITHDLYNESVLKSVALQDGDSSSMLNFFRALTGFKNQYKHFFGPGSYASYDGVALNSGDAFAYTLHANGQKLTIIINHGSSISISGLSGQIVLNLNNNNSTTSLNQYGTVVYLN